MYDIIVVGCGPAGAYASKTLAEKGLSVYCIDKRQELGAPVRCGEGLSAETFKNLNIKPLNKFIAKDIYGFRVVAPNGAEVLLKDKKLSGYLLERKIFDKHLGILAARAGARVEAKTRCTDLIIENGFVKGIKAERFGESFEVESKIVVAADGIDSKIARIAGIDTVNKLNDICAGVQYELAGIDIKDPDLLEFYFGNKVAPGGYLWVFPKGRDVANVGIGIRGSERRPALRYLDEFIQNNESFKKGSIIEVNAGGVPVGGICKTFTSNGLMLVGDAAHQVNPIHGGGMGIAMESAKILSDVAYDAIEQNDFSDKFLSRYKREWDNKYGLVINRLLKLRMFLEKLTDEQLNLLASILSGEEVFKIACGDYKEIFKVLIKKAPKMAKLAVSLLM